MHTATFDGGGPVNCIVLSTVANYCNALHRRVRAGPTSSLQHYLSLLLRRHLSTATPCRAPAAPTRGWRWRLQGRSVLCVTGARPDKGQGQGHVGKRGAGLLDCLGDCAADPGAHSTRSPGHALGGSLPQDAGQDALEQGGKDQLNDLHQLLGAARLRGKVLEGDVPDGETRSSHGAEGGADLGTNIPDCNLVQRHLGVLVVPGLRLSAVAAVGYLCQESLQVRGRQRLLIDDVHVVEVDLVDLHIAT
mmetsp:Transcript_116125/g.339555  ORF Transcript_116125/g.339555 Transcript_116125/m.339555 type:complete len:248 (-) Transcript_116125:679-1422(-)